MGIPKYPERSTLPCVEENTHSSIVLHFFQKLCSFLYFPRSLLWFQYC